MLTKTRWKTFIVKQNLNSTDLLQYVFPHNDAQWLKLDAIFVNLKTD